MQPKTRAVIALDALGLAALAALFVLWCAHTPNLTAAGGILPEDAGKALRAEHRIDGIFQHQNMVGNAKAQCAAA